MSVFKRNMLKLLGDDSVFNNGEASLNSGQGEDHTRYDPCDLTAAIKVLSRSIPTRNNA